MLKRTVWGITAAFVFAAVLFKGGILFHLSVMAIAILGLVEYFNMVERLGRKPYEGLTIGATLLFLASLYFFEFRPLVLVTFIGLFLLFIMAIPIYYSRGRSFVDGAVSIFGFMYVSIPSGIFITLRQMDLIHALLIVGYTWVNDSFAFFTGKLFGRHKLSPSISPGKTWEGFLGGALFSMLFGYIMGISAGLPPWKLALYGLIMAIFGTFGDLAESVIKREAGFKDSGNFIPGHGGVLDRVDALIINIMAYYVLMTVLGI